MTFISIPTENVRKLTFIEMNIDLKYCWIAGEKKKIPVKAGTGLMYSYKKYSSQKEKSNFGSHNLNKVLSFSMSHVPH